MLQPLHVAQERLSARELVEVVPRGVALLAHELLEGGLVQDLGILLKTEAAHQVLGNSDSRFRRSDVKISISTSD